jgi:hypothetical protein
MRIAILLALLVCCVSCARTESQPPPGDAFEQMKSHAGEWQADLPGYGRISNSIRLVSNGKAIEETIGTPTDNEVSLYTRDENRLLLTHFCALTPDGHQVRLETPPLQGTSSTLEFGFVGATNLHDEAAPHMRRVVITFLDQDHLDEKWTKTEKGVDTVFDLSFVRR